MGEEDEKNNYCTLMFLRQRSMTQRPGTATQTLCNSTRTPCVYRVMPNHVSVTGCYQRTRENQRNLTHPVWGWQLKPFEAGGVALSNDTAFIVAMHPMHWKEKYKSLGLEIFGLESPWPWKQQLPINYSWALLGVVYVHSGFAVPNGPIIILLLTRLVNFNI